MMMPARRCFLSSFSRHRFRPSTRCALIRCRTTRYRIQQLLQLLLVASRLLLLQHLRLCSITLLLTRCTPYCQLSTSCDNHEEWLPFSEVVKLLPKSWARDEEQANIVAIFYALTEVVADEKLSTNPAQVAATYTEPLKYQDALIAPDRVL
jgi:hypothetical protein